MVRKSLGDDAVIVATREEAGGKGVRVTAAIDRSAREENEEREVVQTRVAVTAKAQAAGRGSNVDVLDRPTFARELLEEPAGEEGWLQYDREDEENAVIEKLTDVMLRHGVSDDITDQIISCATVMGMERADVSLTAAIEHLYSFKPLPQKAVSTATMLVGPPGSGKTLAVAKLAARSVMSGLRVAVITTDTVRAGGIEQLSAFMKILRVGLQRATNPHELRAAIEASRAADQVIIDTGGHNPFDAEEVRSLARFMASGDIEPVLTLPAGIDADESGELARVYAAMGVRSLMPTRVDIARRLGGLLSAAHHGAMIFTDAGNTPKVAEGLLPLSPQVFASLLMPSMKTAAQSRTNSTTRRTKTG